MTLTWNRHTNKRASGTARRSQDRRVRPWLEALEDRWLPTGMIMFVQQIGSISNYSSSPTATFTSAQLPITAGHAVTANHSIFVEFAMDPASGAINMTDSAGNLYTKDADVTNGKSVRTVIFSSNGVKALPVGGYIQATFAANHVQSISATEFCGVIGAGALDGTHTSLGSSNVTPTSGTISLGTPPSNELLVGAIGVEGNVDTSTPNDGTDNLGFTAGSGWTVSPGNGTLSGNAGNKNNSIHPEFQLVTAGGTYQANGILNTNANGRWATAIAAYKADVTDHFTIVPSMNPVTAGVSFTVTVTAVDFLGNPVIGHRGTLVFSSSDPLAMLPANYTFTSADDHPNGTWHTFTVTLDTAGSQTIGVTDDSCAEATGSTTITVLPAAATHIGFRQQPTNTVVGMTISPAVTVAFLDQFNNVATNTGTMTLAIGTNPSGGILSGTLSNPAVNGLATFNNLSIDKKGIGYTLVASSAGFGNATSAAFNITGAVATHYRVTPLSSTAGSSFSVTVTALDASNLQVTDYVGTAHFTTSDLGVGVILPANYAFTLGDAGAHTFTNGVTLVTAGSQSITATDTVNSSVTGSATVVVSAAASTHFAVNAPSSALAGTAINFTVTALDQFNNTATGYTGTVHFTSTDGVAVLPINSTLTNGMGTFSATLKTAGTQRLTATDTVTSSITGTSGPILVSAAAATHFAVTAPSSATAGSAFTFAVTAQDPFNNTASGYTGTVHFTSTDGNATLPANSTLTSGVGTFSATLRTAGTQTLTATDTVTSSITGTSGPILVSAASATHFAVTAPSSATAGSAFTFTVTAQDPFNNTASGYTGTVHFTSTDGAAVVPGNSTLASGVGTFSATLKAAGTQRLTATDTVTSSITGTSGPILVSAASATHFAVSAPSSATAGSAFTFTVTAQDPFNNTATGYSGTAHFTSTDGAAVLPGNSTLTSGVGTFSATLKTTGTQTLTSTDTVTSSITGTSGPITVSAAASTHFAVSAPSSATAGTAFSFTVTALDQFNNTATGYGGSVHFTSTDGNASLPANTTLSSGVGTFSATLKTAGSQSLTATDTVTSSITGTSGPILVSAAASTHFTVSAPGSTTAGTAFTFTVTAQDQFNNTATGYSGSVHFTSTDGSASLPANSTLTSGVGTFSATLRTAGSQTLTATDTVTSSITGTSGPILVSAASATHFAVSAPSSATAGSAFTFTVTAQDQFNNTATGYIGTVHFTSTDGNATLPANSTLSSGVGSFSATLKTAGTQRLTATDTVTSSITGTSGPILVSTASATHFAVSAPSSAAAGTAFTFTVTAQDPFNNTATGYTGTVHFTSSDGAAVLPANSTLTNGMGSFSATLKTVGTQTLTATDTLTSSITGTSGPINVNAAAATHFAVSAPSSTTAGTAFSFIVTAQDAFNNTVTGYSGTVHFTSTDGNAALPSNSTLAGGTGTFSATLKTAGTRTITATDTITSSITGTSGPINVNAATTQAFAITLPASTGAGTAFTMTVTATDAYGNYTPGYLGTAHFTSSDGAATLPPNYLFTAADAGTHTFPNGVTLVTAGTRSITATDTTNSSITGTSTIVVNGAAISKLAVAGFPSPVIAGDSHTFTVTATDTFGNLANLYTGTVHFTSSDAQAALPANYTFTAQDGGMHTFSATLKTVGTQSLTATDTVTPSITGTQAGIVVNAAATRTFTFQTPPNTIAGTPFTVTLTARDAYGNYTPGYLGTVHFTSSDGSASLPANYPFTAADAGIHTFTNGVTLNTAGQQTLTATDTVNAAITGSTTIGVVPEHFDFNAVGTPTAASYFGVANGTLYTAIRGYGWVGTAASSFDRGVPNDLLRDGDYGFDNTFAVDLPNGNYAVTVTMGDATTTRDNMQVYANGATTPGIKITQVPAGQFAVRTMQATVTNGQLTLEFKDAGGDPYYVVNALDIWPAPVPVIALSGPTIPVLADGLTQDTFTGSGAIPGSLVTITTGLGTVTSADASSSYQGSQVLADGLGNFTVTIRRPTSGSFTPITAEETNGARSGSTILQFILPPERHFDFNAVTSGPTAAGFVGIAPTDVYGFATGYGWSSTVFGFDRGTPTTLLRDGNYGSIETPGTFQADLPAGTFSVTVTVGDQSFLRDNIDIRVGGNSVLGGNLISVAAGQFATRTFTFSVAGPANGQLGMQIVDLGGDTFWVVNALDIRPAASVVPISFTSGPGTVGADGLTKDTISGLTNMPDGTLLTVGTNLGTIVGADADPNYAGTQVTVTSHAFSFQVLRPALAGTPTLTAATRDGSAQGTDSSGTVLKYQVAATRRFDFNGPSNFTPAGFLGVRGNTLSSAGLGYGWNSAVSEFERTGPTPLRQDGAFGSQSSPGTFAIQVVPGTTYHVRVYVGDSANARDSIQVTFQDGVGGATLAQYTIASLAAGVFDTTVSVVTPTAAGGGTLALQVADLLGDPFWVVNGMDIWTTADPGVQPQLVLAAASAPVGGSAALTPAALTPVVQAAKAHWLATNLSPAQAALLSQTQFQIGQLEAGVLGQTGLGVPLVQLDATGGGLGWFIDPTPGEDSEFAAHLNSVDEQALPGSRAFGRYDLLTVVEHELGHVLGLDDLSPSLSPNELMTATIGTGERRLPGVPQLPGVAQGVSGGLNVSAIDQVFRGATPLPASPEVAASVDLAAALTTAPPLPLPVAGVPLTLGIAGDVNTTPVVDARANQQGGELRHKPRQSGRPRKLRHKPQHTPDVDRSFQSSKD